MQKKITRTIGLIAMTGLLAAAGTGCGKSSAGSSVPIERNRLVIRLFHSMDGKQYAAAADQAVKLLALDRGNLYLDTVADRQRANAVIEQAQKLLNDGKPAAAQEMLEAALRLAPLDRSLQTAQEQARNLAQFDEMVNEFSLQTDLAKQSILLAGMERAGKNFHDPALNAALARLRKSHAIRVAAEEKRQKELAASSGNAARAALDAANAARRTQDAPAAAPLPANLIPKIPGVSGNPLVPASTK